MAKTTDDPAARNAIADHIEKHNPGVDASAIVSLFKTVSFETATARAKGEEITLTRVTMTSEWLPTNTTGTPAA